MQSKINRQGYSMEREKFIRHENTNIVEKVWMVYHEWLIANYP